MNREKNNAEQRHFISTYKHLMGWLPGIYTDSERRLSHEVRHKAALNHIMDGYFFEFQHFGLPVNHVH
jgi:hypothetical protein